MPRTAPRSARPLGGVLLTPAEIDLMYGLEPLIEAGRDRRLLPLTSTHIVSCPHCWQEFDVVFEAMASAHERIDDCPHCCSPVQLRWLPGSNGHPELEVERAD